MAQDGQIAHGGHSGPSGHIYALDGIRGLAILLVLLHHLFLSDRRGIPLVDGVYRFLTAGWVGVDLFFVLSGFLITGILINSRSRGRYFRNFYARRAVRIFPLYYGIVLAALAAGMLTREQGWVWTYLTNLRITLLNRWEEFSTGTLTFGHFWSLAVEEHFYLVWPVVVFVCPPRWLLRVAVGLAAASLVSRSAFVLATGRTIPAYVFTPFRVDGLLIGAACAVAVRREGWAPRIRKLAQPLLILCLVACLITYALTGWSISSPFVASVGYGLLALTFASLVLLSVTAGPRHPVRALAEWRLLRFFGKYSYGIYALHIAVFAVVMPLVTAKFFAITHSNTISTLLAKPAALGAATLAALLSWNLYEKHFLKLKRYFGGAGKGAPPPVECPPADRLQARSSIR